MMTDPNENTRMDWSQLQVYVKKQDSRSQRVTIKDSRYKPSTADVKTKKT